MQIFAATEPTADSKDASADDLGLTELDAVVLVLVLVGFGVVLVTIVVPALLMLDGLLVALEVELAADFAVPPDSVLVPVAFIVPPDDVLVPVDADDDTARFLRGAGGIVENVAVVVDVTVEVTVVNVVVAVLTVSVSVEVVVSV